MLILMITIACCFIIAYICVLRPTIKTSETCTCSIKDNMRITFSEMAKIEPIHVLQDEFRDNLRNRCFNRTSEFIITKSNLPRTSR